MILRSDLAASAEFLFTVNAGVAPSRELACEAITEVLWREPSAERKKYLLPSILHSATNVADAETVSGLLEGAFARDQYDPNMRPHLATDRIVVAYAGSGKKGLKTVNISSLAAFTACSVEDGINIAKQCSPATSSTTGSQDFIGIVGGKSGIPTEEMVGIMQAVGVGYFELESVVPHFSRSYGSTFLTPHAMSFALAGLVSAFRPDHLVYGLSHRNLDLSVEVLSKFGIDSTTVVTSTFDNIHFVDEVLDHGAVNIARGSSAPNVIKDKDLPHPATVEGCKDVIDAVAQLSDPVANVKKGLKGLTGNNQVLSLQIANNAALIISESMGADFSDSLRRCLEAIREGRAVDKLRNFVNLTSGDTKQMDRLLT